MHLHVHAICLPAWPHVAQLLYAVIHADLPEANVRAALMRGCGLTGAESSGEYSYYLTCFEGNARTHACTRAHARMHEHADAHASACASRRKTREDGECTAAARTHAHREHSGRRDA